MSLDPFSWLFGCCCRKIFVGGLPRETTSGWFFFLRLYVSYAVVVVFVMVGISIDCMQHNLLNISVNMEKLRTLL